jgi:DNA polymerase-3 subunit alpha
MAKKFVHLHVHSEYSLLDGLSNITKLLSHIKENGMDTIALTDHGAMYGAVEFYKEALKQEVKPVIGMEGYTTNVNMRERPERTKFQNFHLLLLAKDREGYQNLMKLTSLAHVEGYYYRPRVDRETLAEYSKGLICTSACAQGELAQSLINEDYEGAKKTAEWFLDVFGKDYYLEVQRHNYADFVDKIENPELRRSVSEMAVNEKRIFDGVKKLSRELGIPIVATNDAHYIKKDDATAQDALVCIATGKNVSDIERLRFIDTPTFYLTTPQEMSGLFGDLPEAIENTVKIAEKCNVNITLGKWYFPEFQVPDNLAPDEYLRRLSRERLKEKIKAPDKETKQRLEQELKIICDKGYAPYFLIVMDMVNWASSKGIITNTRGSAAGSLVSYVLGITTVNPLTYNLPFERFLNPFRPSPPDIDFDVADDRREEVINYIGETYGHDKVAQICTFGRMLARGSVRDVARVLGYPYATGDRIAKLIPLGSQGFPMTIEKALGVSPDLKTFYENDKDAKKVVDLAREIEGNARHISVHAAGVVVAPHELTDFTPIQLEPSGSKIITQYEMHACEDVGLIKFDILGIRNLSILGSSIKIVNETRGKKIDVASMPLNDKKTFEMLSRGETMGVFQLGGSGMTRYLKELKPTRIEDLMVMVALYRPGPMSVIPEYIARKNNPGLVKYLDPRMKEFLDKSYGLIVYQDDLLFCAISLAGYTWEEADKFRKAVGKKIPAEMAAQKKKFVEGVVAKGQTEELAETLWKLFEPFQAYGFNKAHAASYGMVAYQTAYMKANYPVEFMTALLTAESNDTDKISAAVNECRRMSIKVLPPDINESQVGFTIVADKDSLEGKAIRFGLSAIKNVGNAAIEAILEARAASDFHSFADFLARVDARRVNKKVLESLIKVGALSLFGGRASLLFSLDELRNKVSKPKSLQGQEGLFSQDEIKKSTASSVNTQANPSVSEFGQEELQALERQLLGFSLSARPVAELLGPLTHEATHKIFEISPHETYGENVRVAAVVTEVRIVVTRNSGQEMAFVRAEDDTGSIDLVVFPKIFKSTRNVWIDNKPLLISGRVDSRDETPALIVEAIQTEEAGSESENEVFIRIPKEASADSLKRLKNLLLANPGRGRVTLVFEEKKKRVGLPIKILWSEALAREISGLFDNKNSS